MRPTWADIDLSAVAHNVEVLSRHVAPAQMCVVVKADGYGHGAVPVGRAAVDAGATWLAVALVEEGRVLREAGWRSRYSCSPSRALRDDRGGCASSHANGL